MHFYLQKTSHLPLFGQIVQSICQAVRQGQLGPGDQLPTEQLLARDLQVSRPTISRSYERLRMMGVLTSVRGRGTYISDRVFESLGIEQQRVINKVGIVVSAVGQMSQVPVPIRHVIYDVVDGVANRLASTHATMSFICVGRWLDSPFISEADAVALTHQFHEFDGLLLHCPPSLMKQLMPLIRASKRPCVSMHFRSADHRVPHVIYDRVHAIELAIERLVACGHRTIGFIGEDDREQSTEFCKSAMVREALAFHGLTLSKQHTWLVKNHDALGFVHHKLEDKRTRLPDAFFVGTDYIAMQVLSVFKDQGIGIPHDVDLMSFDDLPALNLIRPLLSTIHVPRQEIGYQAADMLISWPVHGQPPASRVLKAKEMIRETCCFVSSTTT